MSTTIYRPSRRGTTPSERPVESGDLFVANAALTLGALLIAVQILAAHVIPPLAAFAALYLALGLLVRRIGARWPVVLTLVVALVHIGGSVRFFVANLAHPESPASFIFEALVLIAGLTLIVGAVLGLRGAPAARRPVALAAAGLGVVAILTSVVAAAQIESDGWQPGDVPVEAVRSTFSEVEVAAGAATLWVDNKDAFHHTLLIDGADVRVELPGRSAVRVDVSLEPGSYRYWCDVPGHEEMEAVLVVR